MSFFRLAALLAFLVAAPAGADSAERVRTGIDVLDAQGFAPLRGKRIGLLTNQTGVDGHGRRTIDVLAAANGVQLVKLFSVEHGIAGTQDRLDVNESLDPATQLPVINIYGPATRQKPTREQLQGIDAVVIDLQDVGVRFYTYEASMANFLMAAAEARIEVVVLDRPNPITGTRVQGPVADEDPEWPNFPYPLPLRHGMTLGELARFINGEKKVGARLTVVAMEGWRRADWYDATGIAWVNPSPNMRSLTAATLYAGVALLEAQGSNISVGRGTETPFELVGAPWISAKQAGQLAQALNRKKIPGVRFSGTTFTPNDSVFKGQACGGVRIAVTERDAVDAPLLGVELIAAIRRAFPGQLKIEANRKLIGNQSVLEALARGDDGTKIVRGWQARLTEFKQARARYLLYR